MKSARAMCVMGLAVLAALACGEPRRSAGDEPTTGAATGSATGPSTRPAMIVASYNINYGNGDLKLVAATIAKSAADIVCLQETNAESQKFLTAALAKQYPNSKFVGANAAGGFGVLSRWPIKDAKWLPPAGDGLFGTLMVKVAADGRDLYVVNVHLAPTPVRDGMSYLELFKLYGQMEGTRAKEIVAMHKALIAPLPAGAAVIVAGDFNSLPGSLAAAWLTDRGFADAFGGDGDTFTRQPTWSGKEFGHAKELCLDYILHTPDLRAVSAETMPSDASDHYLVLARLAWAVAATGPAVKEASGKTTDGQHKFVNTEE